MSLDRNPVTKPTGAGTLPVCRRAIGAFGGLLVFAVPFAAFTNLVLYHFYVRGSFLLDSGLLARLMWHNDLRLTMPASVDARSFFAMHISPLFLALGAISRLLPLTMPQFFAAFIGTSHGLLAVAIFWLLTEGFGMRRGMALVAALAAAVAFAFSGLAVAIALYPHFETFEAAALLLFLVALVLGRPGAATAWFAVALSAREDAGFHAAMFLTVLLGANAIRGVNWPERHVAIRFLAAGIGYGVLALAIQHAFFPGPSSFVRVYLGDPPLAQVTGPLLAMRLGFFLVYRSYLVGPAIGAAIWAVRARSCYPALGFAACLPWLALHFLAVSSLAGTMVGYYAFPFLLALAWPLLGAYMEQRGTGGRPAWSRIVGGFLALVAAGSLPLPGRYNPGRIKLPDAFLHPASLARQARIDAAVASLAAAGPVLGRLMVDNSIAALRPDVFTPQQVAGGTSDAPPDTIAVFEGGFDAAPLRQLAAQHGLNTGYRVPGTPILLFHRLPLPDLPRFGPLLELQGNS